VVTKDVADYALMVGVPARHVGWIGRHGVRLPAANAEGLMVCPESGLHYREQSAGILRCVDLDEDAALPESLRRGERSYRELRPRE
jgi:UDP-2-acetamido-3-amino-2,3-dideoxy-glucuronate N-acetyltransferase